MWSPHLHRESLGVLDNLRSQVYIQVRPVEMFRGRLFHLEDLPDGDVLEPGEIVIRQEQFFAVGPEPYSVSRYVGDFNVRSVCSKRL